MISIEQKHASHLKLLRIAKDELEITRKTIERSPRMHEHVLIAKLGEGLERYAYQDPEDPIEYWRLQGAGSIVYTLEYELCALVEGRLVPTIPGAYDPGKVGGIIQGLRLLRSPCNGAVPE